VQLLQLRLHVLQLRCLAGKANVDEDLASLNREVRALDLKGRSHPLEIITLFIGLADLYRKADKTAEAVALLKTQLDAVERMLGPDHEIVAGLLALLSQFTADEPDVALRYAERAVRLNEQLHGADDLIVAVARHELARAQVRRGDVGAATAVLERARKSHVGQYGCENPLTPGVLTELGLLHAERKEWDRAASVLDEARRLRSGHLRQMLPGLSELEQVNALRHGEEELFYMALSAAVNRPDDERLAELSAGWVLNGKAVALASLMQRQVSARDSKDPKVGALVRE
jgi:hypothetical protein